MTTEKLGSVPDPFGLATAAQVSSAVWEDRHVAERARVTEEDELFLRLDRPGEPWNVHAEVWVGGRLDAERLQSALGAAIARHPMARASLSGEGHWEIADKVEPSLEIADVALEAELDSLRERVLSSTPSLQDAPPFSLTLVRCPGRDALILNLNHGVGDGIGAFRLLASILRAYAGEPDPLPDVDPLRMRDLREFAGRRTLGDRLRRIRERSENRPEGAGGASRVEPDGHRVDAVGGLHLTHLTPEVVEQARGRCREPATFNDLLLAALAVTVRSWNDDRRVAPAPVVLTAPVNIRPDQWSDQLIANLAATLQVSIPNEAQTDLDTAQAAVAERTRRLKAQDFAGMLASGGVIPVWLRRLLGRRGAPPSGGPDETAVLSNVGRPGLPPTLGPDLPVKGLWFSAPARMPTGIALGIAASEAGLFVTLRHGPELFGDDPAERFLSGYLGVLAG
jgi:NRPS condensation-like uncharacterized protein